MSTAVGPKRDTQWLQEFGQSELEQLIRAIVFHPSVPVLIADEAGHYKEASAGVARIFGVPRAKLLGQRISGSTEPPLQPELSQIWNQFRSTGNQEGTVSLALQTGDHRDLDFSARANVLPSRHVLAFSEGGIPSWVRDFAICLLDTQGAIYAWYEGATRIYGYEAFDAVNRHISLLYEDSEAAVNQLKQEFQRAESSGHIGSEGWQVRRDGSRFWANTILMALRDSEGGLQGFARVVRDFTDRHNRDEKLRQTRGPIRPPASRSSIIGVMSGQLDHLSEVNDAFLLSVGYSRTDWEEGSMNLLDITPTEFDPVVELAHEELLQFGSCTPYEKELLHKDGTRVPVLVSTALLQLSPFRWISFIQDLRPRDRYESLTGHEIELKHDFVEIVGTSLPLRRVQEQIEVVAPTDATVLVLGETGTGKELVARAIHRMSPRNKMPFVTLNCAAIPTGLLESELFGYERGAFTGALSQKIGRFEMAHRGTLFLDEVGDIPIDLQPKLLRALQEKCFERLGGTKTIPIDVRLVAATNRNLTQMMSEKLFRSDLYYRLKVFPITTPPLRDRPEDIPVLVRHFTTKYSQKMGRTIEKIPTETMKAFVEWSWPGNVRELENFVERAVILTTGNSLRAPIKEIREDSDSQSPAGTMEQVERDHILRVLRENKGVVSAAATRLGMPRTTLNAMMKKLSISRRDL
ncbi:MAG: sigma 54-interacting transcriptional regulator [Acidobacteria bacterium]|nr:sigma 54-interacting transcriptional regulator [Acidobacteriota bacterium]